MSTIGKQKYMLASLFLLANNIQAVGDRLLSGDMTIRQWLLTAAVVQFGDSPPTMSEVAAHMGSSHQNVKQLAIKLSDKGFLILEKDERDFRQTRIRLTGKTHEFWESSRIEVRSFLNEMFSDFSESELELFYQCFNKLYDCLGTKK